MTNTLEAAPPAPSLPKDWLEMYGDRLYAYAIRRVRRPEVAEDLLQETLLAAFAAWDRFDHGCSISTWLTAILRNKIADHLRSRYRQPIDDHTCPEEAELFDRRGHWKVPVAKWRCDPHRLAEEKEFRGVLDSCMSKLPPRMSDLFLSRVSDGVETSELCRQMQITPENAWMLLHRARLRLRQCLTINWFAPVKK